MIKYDNNTIYDWNFGTSNVIKVYRNNAIVFYKVSGESPTPEYKVCFAVVDDISQYQETEFEDVFDNATEKWYKLNNLNQYEEYGVYGEGRNITYYEGKLTIDDGYEYEWNGSEWINVGEVSGSTATLPNKSFVLNYNAKNYNATTNSIPYTSGQSKAIDAIQNYGTNTIIDHSSDGYISVTANTRLTISGGTTPMYRTNTETGCTMTIVSKARTTKNYSILTCRGAGGTNQMSWMWRYPSNGIFLHGSSSYNKVTYYTATSASPITASVRVSWNGSVQQQINDWTNNRSYSGAFRYGSYQTVNNNGSLFCDYLTNNDEFWQGDFYWVYMSQEVLTDEEIQQVIDYNEASSSEYPIYYTEKSDPLNNLTFNTMAEAQTYAKTNCVYDGMKGIIDGNRYYFDSSDDNGWVENESRLPQGYTEVEYIENSSYATNTQSTTRFNVIGDSASGNIYTIIYDMENDGGSRYLFLFGNNVNVFMQKITQNWANKCIHFKYYGLDVYVESTPLSTKAMIEMDSSGVTVTNITASTSTTNTYSGSVTSVNETHYGVFCLYNTNDSGAYSMKGKIYEIKIESSTHELKNHYIPCYRDSDNKVGLYDIVRDSFYYDQSGQLSLTAGPIV